MRVPCHQGQQDIRREEEDLEADEEVEEVAREECVRHSGHQHEIGRVEDRHRRVFLVVRLPLPDREDEDEQRHDGRHEQHERAEPVGDEGDAERLRPGAEPEDLGAVCVGLLDQDGRDRDDCCEDSDADGPLQSRLNAGRRG